MLQPDHPAETTLPGATLPGMRLCYTRRKSPCVGRWGDCFLTPQLRLPASKAVDAGEKLCLERISNHCITPPSELGYSWHNARAYSSCRPEMAPSFTEDRRERRLRLGSLGAFGGGSPHEPPWDEADQKRYASSCKRAGPRLTRHCQRRKSLLPDLRNLATIA
jgi:hypothetical protein